MLDKSVPFIDVLMQRKKGAPVPDYSLPQGYSFALFKMGDENAWAKIETSVLEFDSEEAALNRFERQFLPHVPDLEKRCLFVQDDNGEKIATSTAWWCCEKRCDPWLNWVAVKPEHQGRGIGKAIVSRATQIMLELDGDKDFYLHTQTWSHRAIKLYEKMGYFITARKNLCRYSNEDYEKAIALLKKIYAEYPSGD
ncbi:MAG: GNAT family N-acetyltransferase [Christensenellales bacterium]|jgi:ribosomal protein S18 acetylase RimI-like enzyme